MIRINLLPAEVREGRALRPVLVRLALGSLVVLLSAGSLVGFEMARVAILREEVAQLDQAIHQLQPALANLESQEQALARSRADISRALTLDPGKDLLGALEALEKHLPTGVWLTRVVADSGVVQIWGEAQVWEGMAAYLSLLQHSGAFDQVTLIRADGQERPAFQFRALVRKGGGG